MSFWFTIVIFGQVVATIGPTTGAVCGAMVEQADKDMTRNYQTLDPADIPPYKGRDVKRGDVYTACFIQETRPKLGEQVD